MERIGFTGTSKPTTQEQRESFREWLSGQEPSEFHHGDCINADADAHDIAVSLGWEDPIIHPPSNSRARAFKKSKRILEPKPYLERNHDIVWATTILSCMPKGREELRSGTWATVRCARKLKRSIIFFWPNGSISTEEFNLEKPSWQFS